MVAARPPSFLTEGPQDLKRGELSDAAIAWLGQEGWMWDECEALLQASSNADDLFFLLLKAACNKESWAVLSLLPQDFVARYRESILQYMTILSDCMERFSNRSCNDQLFAVIQLGSLTDAQKQFLSEWSWSQAEIRELEDASTLQQFFERFTDIALSRGEIALLLSVPKHVDDLPILDRMGDSYQRAALEWDVLESYCSRTGI